MKIHSEQDYVSRFVLSGLCEYASDNPNQWPPYLSHLASSGIQGQITWLSVGKLAAITTFCERTVRAGLRSLEATGAIRCVYRSQGGSQNHPNCYLLTPHLASSRIASKQMPPQPAPQANPAIAHPAHQNRYAAGTDDALFSDSAEGAKTGPLQAHLESIVAEVAPEPMKHFRALAHWPR